MIHDWKELSSKEVRTSWQSPVMIENIRFAAVTVSVGEIVSLVFTTRLSVHVTNVEVKSTLIFPLFVHLVGLQDSAKIFHEIRIHLTLGLTDYIISKKYCGRITIRAE